MNHKQKILITMALFLPLLQVFSQTDSTKVKTISGAVFDATTLLPIEIASVSCGDFSSTFTDMEGKFSIEVKPGVEVITVNAMGYHTSDVVTIKRDSVFVFLKDLSSYSLQENASIGYFDVKQRYVTQSISVVNHVEDRTKSGASSVEEAFDGRVAGLNAITRNGIKGAGSDLFLRGYSSLYANNQPLIVVDGMIFDNQSYGTSLISGFRSNPLGNIDVNDIESVSVIRDAASIYGAKASNGVILIRTNHAVKQATTIDLNVSGGYEQTVDNLPLLDADSYRLYLNEMMLSQGKTGAEIAAMPYMSNDATTADYYNNRNNSDWQKKVFANNFSSNYGLTIKGGDDVALYALNVGYMKQGGIVDGSDNSKFNLRFNSDINISKRISLNSNIGFNYSERNITATGVEGVDDAVHQARIKAPFYTDFIKSDLGYTTPDYSDADTFGVSNPTALLSGLEQKDANYRLFGSFNFNYKAGPHWVISDMVGVSFDKTRQSIFVPSEGVAADTVYNGVIDNQMKSRVVRHLAMNNDLRATYTNVIGDVHHVSGVAGARFNMNTLEEDWGADYNSANDDIHSLGNGNYLLAQKGGFLGDWANMNFYTNFNYDLQKKYFLSVSASLDGSSRFGDDANGITMMDTQFGFFPSVSGAWLVSSEPFMADAAVVNMLKLRASYGLTGNDDIGNYSAKGYYATKNFLGYQGYVQGNLANTSLGWEKNTKLNVGIDLVLGKERVSLSVDAYQNKTTDMFDFVEADILTGFDGYYDNVGGFTTQGMDVAINARLINRPFKWDLGLMLSKFTTEVDELWDNERIETFYGANVLVKTGQSLNQFYGFKTNGVYATTGEATSEGLKNSAGVAYSAGDVRFVNSDNSNQVIDKNDMQVIGDPTPDFTGELFTRISYKNLTLDAAMSFSYGGDVFNYLRYSMERMTNYDNQTEAVLNRWQYEGQVTEMPKATYGDAIGNSAFSDRWIEDGSYARLKRVTLSYVIPVKLGFVKRAEVYATGLNLFTLTNYKGQDPEFSLNANCLSQGIDIGMIPQNRMFMAGIKIGL